MLLERIELSTSPLPMVCSTTELQQRFARSDTLDGLKGQEHPPQFRRRQRVHQGRSIPDRHDRT